MNSPIQVIARSPTVKVYAKLVCVLCLWALWKATANLAFCYLFWITTLAWAVRYIVRSKVVGGLFILLGITSNAMVTLLNNGVMPSVGVASTFRQHLRSGMCPARGNGWRLGTRRHCTVSALGTFV